MKSTGKLVALAVTLLVLAAYAQSPREQLEQLTVQAQANPGDAALRERIVRLGAQIKPPPAIPEEANRREGRGKFAFRSAKSTEDFLSAASEFEAAARAAPWVAGYYSDLCTIYEKVEKYAEAKRNCELYLAGLSDPAQVAEAKQRIAGIEFGLEKASSPRGRTAAMVALLQKQYAGPAARVLICGVSLNQYWQCTDDEARGSNWVNAVSVNAYPKPGPGPVEFKVVGADGELIEVKLGSYAMGPTVSPFRWGCARPNGTDPNAMVWVRCPSWENAGKPSNDKVVFTTDGNGAPLIEYRDSCGGSRGASSCRRAQFILQR